MKVLIISEALKFGGAESITIELANSLLQDDTKVYFAVSLELLLAILNTVYQLQRRNYFEKSG